MAANQQAQDGLRLSRNPSAPFATGAVPPPPTPKSELRSTPQGGGEKKGPARPSLLRHLRSIAASSFAIYRSLPPCGGGSGWRVAAGDGGFDRRAGSHLRCGPTSPPRGEGPSSMRNQGCNRPYGTYPAVR